MVFSNTTPFIALSAIQRLDLMPALLGDIHVVHEVIAECNVGGRIAVPNLHQLAWIKPVESLPMVFNTVLLHLDAGEKHTINTAKQLGARLVIIDEKMGRNLAEYVGLQVMGSLGILLNAKKRGLIPSFRQCVNEMLEQGIRYEMALVNRLAQTVGE